MSNLELNDDGWALGIGVVEEDREGSEGSNNFLHYRALAISPHLK